MKRKILSLAAVGTLALAQSSCFKSDTKASINPDGSAKMKVVTEIDMSPLQMLGMSGDQNPLSKPKELLKELIKNDKTIDVWTDASATTTKAGKTSIILGGFVKDISKAGDMASALDNLPEGANIPAELKKVLSEFKAIRMEKDASGNQVITLAGLDDVMKLAEAAQKAAIAEGKGDEPVPPVTEEMVAQQLEGARQGYAQFKPVVTPFLTSLNMSVEVEIGGTILEANVFEKKSDSVAVYKFTGQQILDFVDGILEDEDLPAKVVKLTGSLDKGIGDARALPAIRAFVEPYVTKLLGSAEPARLVIKPGAAVFDYAAESAKAKAGQSAELKALIEEAKSGKSTGGGSVPLPGKKAG